MPNFERTDTDFIQSKARNVIKDPKIGRVVQVYEHLTTEDNSNFEADVVIDGGLSEERAKPYTGIWSDAIAPPKVGDYVIVDYLAGEKRRPVITDIVYTNNDRPPLARSGMHRDLYEAGSSPVGDGDLHQTKYTHYSSNPARVNKNDLNPVETWLQWAKHPATADPPREEDVEMRVEMYDSPTDEEDSSHIRLDGTQVDGDSDKGIETLLDFKAGTATTETVDDAANKESRVEHDVKNHTLVSETVGPSNETRVEHDLDAQKLTIEGSGSSETTIEIDILAETATVSNNSSEAGFTVNFSSGTFKLLDGGGYGIESDGSGNFTWYYESIDYNQGSTTSL